MKEKTEKRLERIEGIMELADKRNLSLSISMTLHSTNDPEAVKKIKRILRGTKKEVDSNGKLKWLRFHDGKEAESYIGAGFYINIFCPSDTL